MFIVLSFLPAIVGIYQLKTDENTIHHNFGHLLICCAKSRAQFFGNHAKTNKRFILFRYISLLKKHASASPSYTPRVNRTCHFLSHNLSIFHLMRVAPVSIVAGKCRAVVLYFIMKVTEKLAAEFSLVLLRVVVKSRLLVAG